MDFSSISSSISRRVMMVPLTLTAMPLTVTGPDCAHRAGQGGRSSAARTMEGANLMKLLPDCRKRLRAGQGPRAAAWGTGGGENPASPDLQWGGLGLDGG